MKTTIHYGATLLEIKIDLGDRSNVTTYESEEDWEAATLMLVDALESMRKAHKRRRPRRRPRQTLLGE